MRSSKVVRLASLSMVVLALLTGVFALTRWAWT
jgi:hypothetical protein